MTEDQFRKRSFRAFQEILYKNDRIPEPISCILLAVDFDNLTMHLEILPNDHFEEKAFWVACDWCHIPPKGLKIVKS